RKLGVADEAELFAAAKDHRAPVELVREVAERGELPVPLFCAGGIATPADAALVMQLGAQAGFVGSGIFKSEDPSTRAKAIVEATTHYADATIVAKVSRGLGGAMRGDEIDQLDVKLAERGWGSWRPTGALQGMKAGVLALQGAFREHREVRAALGVEGVEVRVPEHLGGLDALFIPGGESTTIGKLLDTSGLREPLHAALTGGLPVFGTCAGLILLAGDVRDRNDAP